MWKICEPKPIHIFLIFFSHFLEISLIAHFPAVMKLQYMVLMMLLYIYPNFLKNINTSCDTVVRFLAIYGKIKYSSYALQELTLLGAN